MIPTLDLMDRLKFETAELHDQAEGHDFQERLVKGKLSRAGYIEYLTAMFHVHRALERGLNKAAQHDTVVASLPLDRRYREESLRRDLAHFDIEADETRPIASVSELATQLDVASRQAPSSLIGSFYVLEGSTNGSRFVARAVRRAYELPGTVGTEYLDPYGDEQRAQWSLFKEQMRALPLTPAQQDGIVDAAKAMFMGVMHISDELVASTLRERSDVDNHDRRPQAPGDHNDPRPQGSRYGAVPL